MNFQVSTKISWVIEKMEQLGFKSSYSIPAQKLGFYVFEKGSFCSLNVSLKSLKFVSGSSPRHILKVLPSVLIILLLKAYMELWVGMKIVRQTYLAYVVKSNPRLHHREVSYS